MSEDALRQAHEDLAARWPRMSMEDAGRIMGTVLGNPEPLRRGGVAIRIPRWRRWWMRLMPKRGRLWLQRETLRQIEDVEPAWPRIHLFRLPRRELVLVAGAVASGLLAARYGLSPSEGTLVAGPAVAGWVASEVVGS